ncbi:MAG: YihY/virulence factor BrkB family protein [Bryobacterales bacterium]|nr:YihY/virulence factor BrkB family protein [Bryobacterales bacterium]
MSIRVQQAVSMPSTPPNPAPAPPKPPSSSDASSAAKPAEPQPPICEPLATVPTTVPATTGEVSSIQTARPRGLVDYFKPTVNYWMETEVHVYGFSIAANVLLSFFPFLIVMVSFFQNVLQWREAADAVYFALGQYFPDTVGDFLSRNLRSSIATRGKVQVGSLLLLMFVANGIFEPLEVALNRVWGVTTNRSFLKNQILSMGMIFLCGSLAMLSIVLTTVNMQWFTNLGLPLPKPMLDLVGDFVLKLAAFPITVLMLFFIYWLLPNRKVPARMVFLPAFWVALALEAAKYLNLLLWPLLRIKLTHEYGPFINSAAIVLWSFLAAMIVLAGAEWAARYWREAACEEAITEAADAKLAAPKTR